MDRRFEGRSGTFGARGGALLLACVGLGLTLGVATLFASSAPSFAAARSYPTGGVLARSVAIGDLNGDGKADLAIAAVTNTVSVLLNRGNGIFQARRDYRIGFEPRSVAIGDLNGDGKPDLATANAETDTVSVLLNRGDGSFQAKLDYATGDGPRSIALGDLNGDGKPDLATANGGTTPGYDEDTVSVLLNKGDGSFEARLDYGTGREPSSVALGDLNGDGKPDLATANFADTVSVLLNRGDGSFAANRDYGTGPAPVLIAIGDLNGDGKPDLATANIEASTVSVLVNRGDGSVQAKLDYRTGRAPYSVAIGDLSGDRKPDLATANNHYPSTLSVLLNTPGLCTVQNVKGQTVPAAKRAIARGHCRAGKTRRAYSKTVRRGRVISQKPKFGTVLPNGGKVNIVVSRGRKR